MKKQLHLIVALVLSALAMNAYSLGWELNETNTGLAGVGLTCDSLPAYTGSSKPAAGTTITMQKITLSQLDLSNGNITLDRVCVKPANVGNSASIIYGYPPDAVGDQNGPVTIQDSDIDGSGVTNSLIYATCAFRGAGSLYRNNIWGMGSGICYFGASTVSTSVLEANYVHDLRGGTYAGGQSHNESATIRSFNGTSMVWRNNKLISKSGSDSGALFINTYAGLIKNVTIEGNYFDSFGYDMPLEAAYGNTYSSMQSINNRFVISGYGVGYVSGGPGWDVWSNNYIYNSGAIDGKGAVVDCPGGTCASAVDTTAPSVPSGLTASTVSPTQINLSWTASTDNMGVYQYDIRRCSGTGCTPSTVIASPTTNSYNNTGLSANTLYRYDVRARDLAGNSSAYSSVAQAQTDPPDTTAPTTPGTPIVTATGNNTATLTWTASTDNFSVANYIVYRCSGTGCTPSTQVATPTSNSYSDSGLTKNTLYRYAVRAVDPSSNQSALSGIGQATTQNNTYDTPTIDSSTPSAIKSNAGSLTTASFNPPAGSVLYVMLMTQNQTSSPTVASSGLTFTSRGNYGTTGNDTYVRLWTAPVNASGARTVTVTQAGSGNYALMKVLVVTGANSTTPVANVSGSASNTGAISTTYTSTSDNSLGWALYADWTQGAVPTPGTGVSVYDSYTVAGEDTYAILKRTAVTPTAGTSVTLNTTAPTSGRQTAWLVFEMLPSSGGSGGSTPSQPPAPLANGKIWQLNFAEEFSGTTLDTSKLTPCFDWNYGSCTESFNTGKERYLPSQVQVSGGTAKLVAEPLSPAYASAGCYNGSCTYKAGLVATSRPLANNGSDYLYKFTYGYVESKMKFPGTPGFFTAFWMLPASTSYTYPTEIDIAEILGGYPNTVFMNYHYNNRSSNYTPNNGTGNNGICTVKDYSTDWVTLGLDWQPTYIAWYIDGVKCGQFDGNTSTIESGPMQIMLHMMVDNQWERDWGSVLANQTLSATLEVDYLRVWQQMDSGTGDIMPPTITISNPSSVLPVGTSSTTVSVTTDESATCKFTSLPNIIFNSKNTFSTTGTTSHSQTINYLKPGNVYHYYIACADSSNNISNDSLISFYINTQNKKFRK